MQANVTSLIDYCNALLAGAPSFLTDRLQCVQNCAARVVKRAKKRCHITPLLRDLHWLPVAFRIQFKINIMTFKSVHGLGPVYLNEMALPYVPTRTLRSSEQNLLSVPKYRLKTIGARAYSVQGPLLWNSLPSSLKRIDSLSVFKRQLKAHYFRIAF